MIKPVVKKFNPSKYNEDIENIRFWMSQSGEERMKAMGFLHLQMIFMMCYMEPPRIQKIDKKVKWNRIGLSS